MRRRKNDIMIAVGLISENVSCLKRFPRPMRGLSTERRLCHGRGDYGKEKMK
jgi:hypothetical protein